MRSWLTETVTASGGALGTGVEGIVSLAFLLLFIRQVKRLTCLRDSEESGVALSPVQAAAIWANLELVLVAPQYRSCLSLQVGPRHLRRHPVGGDRQEGTIENLKAIEVMRLSWQ